MGHYKDNRLYNVITEESFDLSMVSQERDDRTLEGLEIIAVMGTMALECGVDLEEMAGRVFECSRSKGSLGDTLSMNIAKFAQSLRRK